MTLSVDYICDNSILCKTYSIVLHGQPQKRCLVPWQWYSLCGTATVWSQCHKIIYLVKSKDKQKKHRLKMVSSCPDTEMFWMPIGNHHCQKYALMLKAFTQNTEFVALRFDGSEIEVIRAKPNSHVWASGQEERVSICRTAVYPMDTVRRWLTRDRKGWVQETWDTEGHRRMRKLYNHKHMRLGHHWVNRAVMSILIHSFI